MYTIYVYYVCSLYKYTMYMYYVCIQGVGAVGLRIIKCLYFT